MCATERRQRTCGAQKEPPQWAQWCRWRVSPKDAWACVHPSASHALQRGARAGGGGAPRGRLRCDSNCSRSSSCLPPWLAIARKASAASRVRNAAEIAISPTESRSELRTCSTPRATPSTIRRPRASATVVVAKTVVAATASPPGAAATSSCEAVGEGAPAAASVGASPADPDRLGLVGGIISRGRRHSVRE